MNEAHIIDLRAPCQRENTVLFVCRQFQQIDDLIANLLSNCTANRAARRQAARRIRTERSSSDQTYVHGLYKYKDPVRRRLGYTAPVRAGPGGGVVFVQQVLHAEADFAHRQGVATGNQRCYSHQSSYRRRQTRQRFVCSARVASSRPAPS